MEREDGFHVVHKGTSVRRFSVEDTDRADLEAAAYALRPGEPRMSVEIWDEGECLEMWHPDDIDITDGQPRLISAGIEPYLGILATVQPET